MLRSLETPRAVSAKAALGFGREPFVPWAGGGSAGLWGPVSSFLLTVCQKHRLHWGDLEHISFVTPETTALFRPFLVHLYGRKPVLTAVTEAWTQCWRETII